MDVNIITNTNGKGKWSEEERMVIITKLDIGFNSQKYYPEEEFSGELRAYFDPHGFTKGSWNVAGHGLICADKLWIKEFKVGLRNLGLSFRAAQNITYNEVSMQGDSYVSLNVGPRFWASWKKLLQKNSQESKNSETSNIMV